MKIVQAIDKSAEQAVPLKRQQWLKANIASFPSHIPEDILIEIAAFAGDIPNDGRSGWAVV